MIRIRGHHLLCIQGFQGYGYSPKFVANMNKIVRSINSTPELLIEVTDDCDDICIPCPHNVNNICSKDADSAKNVRDMDLSRPFTKERDLQTLSLLSLKPGDKIKAKDINNLVNRIPNKIDIISICSKCEWKNVCTWFTSLQQTQ
ncbi:MAG: DUF1284 domain-containing protein [bacterium]|nr:DUF1284 domain-containing protein [bacterium]